MPALPLPRYQLTQPLLLYNTTTTTTTDAIIAAAAVAVARATALRKPGSVGWISEKLFNALAGGWATNILVLTLP